MQRHGARMLVDLDADGCTVSVLDGHAVPIDVTDDDGTRRIVEVHPGDSLRIPRRGPPS